jgi:signal transduction protein with GAF and PtsI domain
MVWSGLVGAVIKNGALVNLKDAQSDPLFDRTYDVKARCAQFIYAGRF